MRLLSAFLFACAGSDPAVPTETSAPDTDAGATETDVPEALVEDATFDDMAGYVAACEAVLGPVPPLSCSAAVEVPITVTDADGMVHPVQTSADLEGGNRCDRPSVGGCGAGTRIGLATNANGTSFVFGCRNYDDTPAFDQINVVATNEAGITCFFSTRHRDDAYGDGADIPHPGSGSVPGQPDLPFWYTLEEQLGSACVECHDNDPLLRNPWVDQPGNVPELDPLRPYRLVGEHRLAQGTWQRPRDIVHPDSAPCRACHRLADGYSGCFMAQVAGGRAPGQRTTAYATWPDSVWMPERDNATLLASWPTQAAWEASFGPAMDALASCCSDAPPAACFAD